jgi:hypothetical protein
METRRYAALHHRRQARQLRIVNLQPPQKNPKTQKKQSFNWRKTRYFARRIRRCRSAL